MKLSLISENFVLQKLREMLKSAGYFNRPIVNTDQPYSPTSGHDAGSRAGGSTYLPTGMPWKARHRRFLGMEQRPGAIRL